MGTRSRTGLAVLLLASISLLVFTPPTFAQVETVGDFLLKLARAAGVTSSTPGDAITGLVGKNVLSKGLANSLTSQTALPLTKGVTSRILADALHDTQLAKAPTQNIVDTLAQRGIMEAGPADSIVTTEEATAILTNSTVAAAMSTAATQAPPRRRSGALLGILAVALLAAAAGGGHGGGSPPSLSPASP
jgi:hypothetical protein